MSISTLHKGDYDDDDDNNNNNNNNSMGAVASSINFTRIKFNLMALR